MHDERSRRRRGCPRGRCRAIAAGAAARDADPRFPAAAFAGLAADGALAPHRRRPASRARATSGRRCAPSPRADGSVGRILRGPPQRRRADRASPRRSRCARTSSPPSREGRLRLGVWGADPLPERGRARLARAGRRRLGAARREGVLLRRRRARPRARDSRASARRPAARSPTSTSTDGVEVDRDVVPRAAACARRRATACASTAPACSRVLGRAGRAGPRAVVLARRDPHRRRLGGDRRRRRRRPRWRDLAARGPSPTTCRRSAPGASSPRGRRSTAGSSTPPRAPTPSRRPTCASSSVQLRAAIADAGRDDPRRGRPRVRLAAVRHRHAARPRAPRLRAVRAPAPARPDARARRPRRAGGAAVRPRLARRRTSTPSTRPTPTRGASRPARTSRRSTTRRSRRSTAAASRAALELGCSIGVLTARLAAHCDDAARGRRRRGGARQRPRAARGAAARPRRAPRAPGGVPGGPVRPDRLLRGPLLPRRRPRSRRRSTRSRARSTGQPARRPLAPGTRAPTRCGGDEVHDAPRRALRPARRTRDAHAAYALDRFDRRMSGRCA